MATELLLENIEFNRLHDWLGDWCLAEDHARHLMDHLADIDLGAHIEFNARSGRGSGEASYEVNGNVAVISIRGELMKSASSFGGTSTVQVRRSIRMAASDPEVASIVLSIDSPGGTVAGTKELGDEVSRANQTKPVVAVIEDLGASAAYWVASQAGKVVVNETGSVGSIGTYGVVTDMSGLAAQKGVKVHVVRAGKFKGAGVPGTEVDASVLQMLQERIDQLNQFFLEAVSKGRNMPMERVQELADGRVHIGKAAVSLGLADEIGTLESVVTDLQARYRSREKMSATIQEIKASCPGIDAETAVSYLEAGKTTEQAKDAWMQELALRAETAREEADKTKAELVAAQEAAAKAPGVDPLPESGNAKEVVDCDASAFWEAVDAKVKAGVPKAKAVSQVVKKHPELHKAMLAESNAR